MTNQKPTLLFDWGGVLAPRDSLLAAKYLSKKYQCDYNQLLNLLTNEDRFSTNQNYEGYLGKITKRFNIPREDITTWKNKSLPNSTFEFCHMLKNEGYELYLLSNQMQFRTDFIKNNYDLSCFKQTFFSSEIGSIKPNKKPFLHVIKETGIEPHNTFFIDDNRDNITIANTLGFKGILYTDLTELKKILQV